MSELEIKVPVVSNDEGQNDIGCDPTTAQYFSSCSSASVSPSSSSILNNYTNTKTTCENTNIEDEDIIDSCLRIRATLNSLCKKYYAPSSSSIFKNNKVSSFVPKSNYTIRNFPILPMILLLGNHSSGKSSFVNYILGQKIQKTGVAPTDDCFTLILSGDKDENYSGYNLVNDKNFGFEELKQFGMNLINHTKLKIRKDLLLNDVILVDSPGMIDIPGYDDNIDELETIESSLKKTSGDVSNHRRIGRGYNFTQVCRWYAERADIILLFFDPEKPGTTGETLNTLSNALSNMDHKLFIILNKADKFVEIVDFAKTIGTLSWNLSKVINKKDFPRIYTMYIPNEKNKLLKRGEVAEEKVKKAMKKKKRRKSKRRINKHNKQNIETQPPTIQISQEKINQQDQTNLSDNEYNLINSNGSFDLAESLKSSQNEIILGDDSDLFLKKSNYGQIQPDGVRSSDSENRSESTWDRSTFESSEDESDISDATREKGFLDYIIDDLECTREEIIKEITNASTRKINNEILNLTEEANLLYIHCRTVSSIGQDYRNKMLKKAIFTIVFSVITVASSMFLGYCVDLWLKNHFNYYNFMSLTRNTLKRSRELINNKTNISNKILPHNDNNFNDIFMNPQEIESTQINDFQELLKHDHQSNSIGSKIFSFLHSTFNWIFFPSSTSIFGNKEEDIKKRKEDIKLIYNSLMHLKATIKMSYKTLGLCIGSFISSIYGIQNSLYLNQYSKSLLDPDRLKERITSIVNQEYYVFTNDPQLLPMQTQGVNSFSPTIITDSSKIPKSPTPVSHIPFLNSSSNSKISIFEHESMIPYINNSNKDQIIRKIVNYLSENLKFKKVLVENFPIFLNCDLTLLNLIINQDLPNIRKKFYRDIMTNNYSIRNYNIIKENEKKKLIQKVKEEKINYEENKEEENEKMKVLNYFFQTDVQQNNDNNSNLNNSLDKNNSKSEDSFNKYPSSLYTIKE